MISFATSLLTCDAKPLLVGGFLPPGCNPESGFSFLRTVSFGSVPGTVEIDLRLYELLSRAFPGAALLGGCVRIAEEGPVTGGILGQPNSPSASSDGKLELLDCGLWLLCYPGGPGAAFAADHPAASSIAEEMDMMRLAPKKAAAQRLLSLLQNAPHFLVVSDGSGTGSWPLLCIDGYTLTFS